MGLGWFVRKRRPIWEKGVARDWATCRRVVVVAKGETRSCGSMNCLLLEIFPSVGRLGRGDSKGGVDGRKQCRWNIFQAAEVI